MATDASADPLLQEIRALEAKYERCKAVHDVGSYRCILDVPFKAHGTTVKFQIEDGYPSSVPDILVKSARLLVEQRAKLEEALRDFCRSHAEPADATDGSRTTLLLKLADYANVWLQANCVDYTGLADGDEHAAEERQECEAERSRDRPAGPRGKSGPRGGGKARAAVRSDSDHTSAAVAVPGRDAGKKPPMRTAEDVIKRITWDKSLSPERFAVGYVDRFVGVIEKPFTDFTWESLVDADRGTLAVPQHRIAYFKYDGLTVWDKNTRLDNVFGSIGGTTIADVVAAAGPAAASQLPASDGNGCNDSTDVAGDDESSTEAIDSATTATSGYNLTETSLVAAAAEADRGSTAAAAVDKPNYFVCLRVTSPDTVARVAALQADLLRRRPELAAYVLPPSRLHVTLAVLRLPVRSTAVGRPVGDDEAERMALQALRKAADAWTRGPLRLDVAGLAQFGRRVLYGRVRPSEDLDAAAAAVRLALVDAGVAVLDEPFVPHMTIVKLPVTAARGRGRRGGLCIDASDVASGDAVTSMPFGDDRVASLHLCSFLKDQINPAEFYNSVAVELPPQRTSSGSGSSETQRSWGDETDSAW